MELFISFMSSIFSLIDRPLNIWGFDLSLWKIIISAMFFKMVINFIMEVFSGD